MNIHNRWEMEQSPHYKYMTALSEARTENEKQELRKQYPKQAVSLDELRFKLTLMGEAHNYDRKKTETLSNLHSRNEISDEQYYDALQSIVSRQLTLEL